MYAFYDQYEEPTSSSSVITRNHTYNEKIPFNTFVYVFRYNGFYETFGCPLFCTIKSNLTRINIFEDKGINYNTTVCHH